jgi:hypothetical protein
MTVPAEKLAIILDHLANDSLFVAKYLAVEWPDQTRYYSTTAYSDISPFRDIKNYTDGASVHPVLLGDPFESFEINGDVRTENINLTFDDPSGTVKELFKTYGAAKASIYFYYPQADLNHNPWWGQLLPPEIAGRYTQQARLTNGYKAKEWFIPNSTQTEECRFAHRFGGMLDTADKIATNAPRQPHIYKG